jgi:tRNA(Ile)-lysidine synthase
MDLLDAFNDYINREKLFTSADRLLLAVSGGLDSVVLCELCNRAGIDFVVAHCNFQLRGEESLRDEDFVRRLAAGYGKEVAVKKFDTTAFAAAHKLSVQVAARELRYGWFREVAEREGLRCVVTAHQLDDNIETLLMNFFKGTGIGGLRAMLPRQGMVVRPLLFAGRAQILLFAERHGLVWVEDSSNQSDKYTRNYFRHQVIPLIGQVYPAVLDNLADNIGRFRDIEIIYREAIGQQQKKLLEYRGAEVHIPVLKLLKAAALSTLLYEIVSPYGFSPQQAEAVKDLLGSESGKYVVSATHRILKNRNYLIISPLGSVAAENILVEGGDTGIEYAQGALRISRLEKAAIGTLDQGQRVALLDGGALKFPLLLRRWRPGDYFYPLGMRKKKKLSRFFIDNKLSLAEKEKVWVLEMDKKIVWVVGWRIDDRWRLGPGTREVVRIEFNPSAGDASRS